MSNCIVSDNIGDLGGGIGMRDAVSASVFNTLLAGNTARRGGAVYNNEDGILKAVNITVAGNTATASDGGLRSAGNATIEMLMPEPGLRFPWT